VLAILITPLVGRNIHRMDPRVLATASMVVFAVVMLMRSGFNTQADQATILVPTIIQGAGVAVFFLPLITLTLSGRAPQDMAAASGLSNFARITAGSFGTSISTTLWDHRATLHHAQLAERITAYDPVTSKALADMQASGMTPDQSMSLLNRMIDQQAALLSANDIFYASAILFVLLIGVIWLTKPIRATVANAEASGAH
jgi:DHA2 family multidrug resistance protein